MTAVIRQLQDSMTVMAGIEARQAEALKGQAEWLEGHQKRLAEHDRFVAEHQHLMKEMDGKLNALIAIVDGMIRGKQQ